MLLTDSLLDYLLYERSYSEGIVGYYQADILELQKLGEELLGDLAPSDVDAGFIREWITSSMDRGCAPNMVNRKLSFVRSYYKYPLQKGMVAADPLQKITGPKRKKLFPVSLRKGDANRLPDDIDFGEGFEECRDRLIIEIFYVTGIRLSELTGSDDKDIDSSVSLIKVTGRRNKQCLLSSDEELRYSIQEYVNMRSQTLPVRSDAFFIRKIGEGFNCNIVAYVMKRDLSKVVIVRKRSPHVSRHAFAMVIPSNGADLGSIKELLGHKSLATTEVHAHTTFEELKEVYNRAHPRV